MTDGMPYIIVDNQKLSPISRTQPMDSPIETLAVTETNYRYYRPGHDFSRSSAESQADPAWRNDAVDSLYCICQPATGYHYPFDILPGTTALKIL